MKQCGIDEAGLGPMLGPYCLGLAEFSCREKQNLFKTLKNSVSQNVDSKKIAIGDSKKLYSSQKGIYLLEESVLILVYSVFGLIPDSFNELMGKLTAGQFRKNQKNSPWFGSEFDFSLPLSANKEKIIEKAEQFKSGMVNAGVSFDKLSLRFLSAKEFNRQLDKTGNKSTVCLNQVASFLESDNEFERFYYIDRQGGRSKYGDWLIMSFPGRRLQAFEEGKCCSRYRLDQSELLFSVGSDDTYLETATASLIAKYSRELAMNAFNHYWNKKVPTINPTAGYVSDGRRFVADLKAADALPEDIDILVRKK